MASVNLFKIQKFSKVFLFTPRPEILQPFLFFFAIKIYAKNDERKVKDSNLFFNDKFFGYIKERKLFPNFCFFFCLNFWCRAYSSQQNNLFQSFFFFFYYFSSGRPLFLYSYFFLNNTFFCLSPKKSVFGGWNKILLLK